jgi:hypothetical protein
MAEQLLVAGRIHNIINILEFIKLPGKEVNDLLKDFIKYIIELYIGPNCDIEIDKEVIKQP